MNRNALLLIIVLSGGCSHDPGTISPQAQANISRLPAPVVSAFRHEFTGVTSARAQTRLMPDQSIDYEIDFVDGSNQRRTVHYRADGTRVKAK